MAFLAAIPAWVQVAGAAVSAVGSIMSAQKQASMYEQNARVNEQNALLMTAQATEQERRQRAGLEELKARQRVGVAKSGVTMNGTPLLVAEDITGQGELDALTIRYNGEMKSNDQKYQAAVNRYQASEAKTSGYFKAATSILGGMAGFAGSSAALGGGLSAGTGSGLASMGGGSGISGGITTSFSNSWK